MIRKAATGDTRQIQRLINHYAEQKIMLPRSLNDIFEHMRDYSVFESAPGDITGVVAMHVAWEDLGEVRSLAIREDMKSKGIGRQLVEHTIAEAKTLGLTRLFALTYVPDFFKKLGFIRMDKHQFPHKVWFDCVKCHKFPDCDETAMIFSLDGSDPLNYSASAANTANNSSPAQPRPAAK